MNFADQVSGAAFFGGGFEEVTASAGAKVFGLADVDYAAGGIFHQIDAGGCGKLADFGERGVEAAGGDWFRLSESLVGQIACSSAEWLFGASDMDAIFDANALRSMCGFLEEV